MLSPLVANIPANAFPVLATLITPHLGAIKTMLSPFVGPAADGVPSLKSLLDKQPQIGVETLARTIDGFSLPTAARQMVERLVEPLVKQATSTVGGTAASVGRGVSISSDMRKLVGDGGQLTLPGAPTAPSPGDVWSDGGSSGSSSVPKAALVVGGSVLVFGTLAYLLTRKKR